MGEARVSNAAGEGTAGGLNLLHASLCRGLASCFGNAQAETQKGLSRWAAVQPLIDASRLQQGGTGRVWTPARGRAVARHVLLNNPPAHRNPIVSSATCHDDTLPATARLTFKSKQ